MAKQEVRPVFMFYPGLYPMLMLNFWARSSKIPITGIILSDFDLKHKGKILNFAELTLGLIQECGVFYMLYLYLVAKFSVPIVKMWNLLRRLMGKQVTIKTFDEIAHERGIPIFRSKDFNSDACIQFIKNLNANLIVSAYNNQIYKRSTYQIAKLGAINVHHSLLPNFRGLDGPFQAILNGVSHNGVTVHRIDAKIDTGDILLQERIKIRASDSVFSLSARCWMHGAKLLEKALKQFEGDTVHPIKQNPKDIQFPYQSFPTKAQVCKFRKQGKRLVTVSDLIRTFR